MSRKLFETLEKKQRYRRPFSSSDDFKYFIENREKIGKFKRFAVLYDNEESEFDIIRANILLKGLENKKLFEEEIVNINNHGQMEHANFLTTLRERTIDQPYYEVNNKKIFIPFFSMAINQIYTDEPEKLLILPYKNLMSNFEDATIDPFDTFGADLFNSYFTNLVKICSSPNGRVTAFFNYDMNTIYLVNNQGRLDEKVVLFDKYIKRPQYTHMIERIVPVCEAYFNNDRQGMIDALYNNNLISQQVRKMLSSK